MSYNSTLKIFFLTSFFSETKGGKLSSLFSSFPATWKSTLRFYVVYFSRFNIIFFFLSSTWQGAYRSSKHINYFVCANNDRYFASVVRPRLEATFKSESYMACLLNYDKKCVHGYGYNWPSTTVKLWLYLYRFFNAKGPVSKRTAGQSHNVKITHFVHIKHN